MTLWTYSMMSMILEELTFKSAIVCSSRLYRDRENFELNRLKDRSTDGQTLSFLELLSELKTKHT